MGVLAAASACLPEAGTPPPVYRPRNPRTTPLFQLFEQHCNDVKALWEDRFENAHGRWRGFTGSVVARYLDCASPECGFARRRCDACHGERLLLFSCRQRNICPSCDLSRRSLAKVDAKRAAAFAAFLNDEVFEDVRTQGSSARTQKRRARKLFSGRAERPAVDGLDRSLIAVIALTAALIPSRRASRVDPVESLR